MGVLRNKTIVQSRNWLDPNSAAIPNFDYDLTYPITVYDAVRRTMDEDSPNLSAELESIYRLIADKQNIIDPGISGNLMVWTGIRGQIGNMEVVKSINTEPSLRSHSKIPTEKGVGDALDLKAPLVMLNDHMYNSIIHINDIERTRWNSMAPLSSLQSHISNGTLHVTNEERQRWNSKADATNFDEHTYNTNNPHGVTAAQVGSYSRREVDTMFEALRESFFNYLNIMWDDRTNVAELTEYHPANWNPNYVLGYGDQLPDVPNLDLTYFALKPTTDYLVSESRDVIIYIKRPGLSWQEIGFQAMNVGDMIIRYPDTAMYVWVQGRFLRLFSESAGVDDPTWDDGGLNGNVWRPVINQTTGELTWILSKEEEAPQGIIIKGQDGYSPVKGVDYDDGQDGVGLASGGQPMDILVKLTAENYDTSWKTFSELMDDLVLSGWTFPESIVDWESISNRPKWYHELGPNADGFMTQKAVTDAFDAINRMIVNDILSKIDGPGGIETVRVDFYNHLNDFNNPHRITPAQIGAVSLAVFNDHTQNFNNPHHVTKDQLGLGNVDNTSDMNKPISDATRIAIEEINGRLSAITGNIDGMHAIVSARWSDEQSSIVFTYNDNSTLAVEVPIDEIFNSIHFDELTKELVIILPDGSEHRIDVNGLIQYYTGSLGTHIHVEVQGDNIIKADIIPSSIGELEIAPSIHLRGAPTTQTQAVGDKSTRIATTEFVKGQVINNFISYDVERPLSANMGRILNETKINKDEVMQIIQGMEGIMVIDHLESTNAAAALSANMGRHLELNKAPRVHTSPSGATFGRATISLFGHTRASEFDPQMDGTVFRGTDDGFFARGDHRHPTDITRAPVHSPEFTGEPRAPIAPDDSNDDRIATTEWIRRNAVGGQVGECLTAGNNPVKVVTLKSDFMENPVFLRQAGSTVTITFKEDDKSPSNVTMDVHGSGPAPVLYGGLPIINGMIKKNHTHIFTFDGTNWRLLNPAGIHPLPDDDNSNSFVSSEWVRRNAVGVSKGFCTTAGNVAIKVVTLKSDFMANPAFLRQTGSTVSITFTHQDVSGATATQLNVHGSGAAPVTFANKPITDNMISADHTHIFTFDGTSWKLLNPAAMFVLDDADNSNRLVSSEWVRRNAVGVSKGDCPTAAATADKIVTLRSTFVPDPVFFLRQIGSTVVVRFTNTDTSTAVTRLNVQNTGFAEVHYEGKVLVANMISANMEHIFSFDGTRWQLLNPAGIHPLAAADNSNRYASSAWVRTYAYSRGDVDATVANIQSLITNLTNGKAPNYHASAAATYGVSSASLYGHSMASSAAPTQTASTASVGTDNGRFAREGHVHQTQQLIFVQASAPSGETNRLWINTNDRVMYFWSGSAWLKVRGVAI